MSEAYINRIIDLLDLYERYMHGTTVCFTPVLEKYQSRYHINSSHKFHEWCPLNVESLEDNIKCVAYTIQESINNFMYEKLQHQHLPGMMEVKICILEINPEYCQYILFIERQPETSDQLAAYNNYYNVFLRHICGENIPFLIQLFERRLHLYSCPRAKYWYWQFLNYLLNYNNLQLPPPQLFPNLELINFWSNNRESLAQDTLC